MAKRKTEDQETFKDKRLTVRQQSFADYYLTTADLCATKAAKMAGYSEKSAYQLAHLNMQIPAVRAYIDERLGTITLKPSEILMKLDQLVRDPETKDPDRIKALELLGKYYKMFTEKTELTGKDGGPIETTAIIIQGVKGNDGNG